MTGEDLRKYIEGHARAGEITRVERARRLRDLTALDAFREYNELCDTAEVIASPRGKAAIEASKIRFLLVRRAKFDRAGGRKR